MMAVTKSGAVLDLAVEVASFYGALRAGGMPETVATAVASEYVRTALNAPLPSETGMLRHDQAGAAARPSVGSGAAPAAEGRDDMVAWAKRCRC